MDRIELSDNNGRKIESIVIVCLLLQWTGEWIANIPAKKSLFFVNNEKKNKAQWFDLV